MLWTYQESPELAIGEHFLKVLSVGETFYVINVQAVNGPLKFRIFEFDPVTKRCSEVMHALTSRNYIDESHLWPNVVTYENSIILYFTTFANVAITSSRWYRIDTITETVKELKFSNHSPEIPWTGRHSSTVIGDHLYILEPKAGSFRPRFHDLNLKTLTMTLLDYKDLLPRGYEKASLLAYGTDIYCFNGVANGRLISDLFVFSTISESWTEIRNICATDNNDAFRDVRDVTGTILNDTLLRLCYVRDNGRYTSQMLDLYDITSEQWTRVEFSDANLVNDAFGGYLPTPAGCCAADNKLFVFYSRTKWVGGSTVFVTPQIHTYYFLPSLETLCACSIVEHKLNVDRLPKPLQSKIPKGLAFSGEI